MDIVSLLGGLGIGSVLTLLLKEYFENRKVLSKRAFDEKREAYIASLDILIKSQAMPEQEASWARVAAMARVRLCASPGVISHFNTLLTPKSSRPAQEKALDDLILAMRKGIWGNEAISACFYCIGI